MLTFCQSPGGGRTSTPTCRNLYHRCASAIRAHVTRQNTISLRNTTEDNRTSSVPKKNTCSLILIIKYPRVRVGTDDQRCLKAGISLHCGLYHCKSIHEASTYCRELKCRGSRCTNVCLYLTRSSR